MSFWKYRMKGREEDQPKGSERVKKGRRVTVVMVFSLLDVAGPSRRLDELSGECHGVR